MNGCGNVVQKPRGVDSKRQIFATCCAGCARTNGKSHGPECTKNQQKTLYHATSKENAEKIRASGTLFRGSGGAYGAGIYFCDRPEHCATKAKAPKPWQLITCKVRLGNMKTVKQCGDNNYRDLVTQGYHSVYAPIGPGGGKPEYVVYSMDQVELVKFEDWNP